MRRLRGAIFGIIALIIVGSGLKAVFSNDSSSSDASSGSVDVTPTSTQPASAPGSTGTYFKVQDATGNSYEVALVKVIDPAQGVDQFTSPASGKRFAGLEFTIKGLSGTLQAEDANNDAFAFGAGGQKYSADFDALAGYTNFDEGAIHVSKDQTVTGTVTFEIAGHGQGGQGSVDFGERLRFDRAVEPAGLRSVGLRSSISGSSWRVPGPGRELGPGTRAPARGQEVAEARAKMQWLAHAGFPPPPS